MGPGGSLDFARGLKSLGNDGLELKPLHIQSNTSCFHEAC